MTKLKLIVKNSIHAALHDSLYRNSILLLASSVINAGFSFVFWVLAARFYTPTQVGTATALISAMGLVSGLGTLGLNNAVIRFLPKSEDKNKLLSTSFIVVTLASLLASIIFILLVGKISPPIAFIQDNPFFMFSFAFIVAGTSLNIVVDNVFTAFRATQYTLAKNGAINLIKLALLLPMIGLAGYGIFFANGIAFVLIAVAGLVILSWKFSYKPQAVVDKQVLRSTAKFSFTNYIVSYVNGFPALILPIIIANSLGTEINATYYLAYTLASILFFVPLGIGNSLFAEGSHTPDQLRAVIRKAAKINAALMIPGVAFVAIFAPFLLSFFGGEYSSNGVEVLRILALSGIFLAICYPAGSILNIRHRMKDLLIVNIVGASSVVGLVLAFIALDYGIIGVAWGWFIGWLIYTIVYSAAVRRALSAADTADTTTSRNRGATAS